MRGTSTILGVMDNASDVVLQRDVACQRLANYSCDGETRVLTKQSSFHRRTWPHSKQVTHSFHTQLWSHLQQHEGLHDLDQLTVLIVEAQEGG